MIASRADRGPASAACAGGLALVALGAALLLRPSAPVDEGVVPEGLPAAKATVSVPGAGGRAVQRAIVQQSDRTTQPARPVLMELPSLDLAARIAPVSVAAGGNLRVPEDPAVLGWWRSGARPGDDRGSIVIDGHVDSATQGLGTFARLRELELGDPVLTESAAGEVRRYWVTGRRQFPKETLPADDVFSQHVQERLVLITCGGRFDPDDGGYADNVVVFAVPGPRPEGLAN
jgi:LPXTG-site transpeptidase (sortase) family protein